jgi:hypothetical protein
MDSPYGDYQGNFAVRCERDRGGMNSAPAIGTPRLVLVEAQPWYASAPSSALERRHALEDERSRLLVLAVGDHRPIELAQRAADLTAQLEQRK